jgi:hypothetical protein
MSITTILPETKDNPINNDNLRFTDFGDLACLPNEIILKILSLLPCESLPVLSGVNRSFADITRNPELKIWEGSSKEKRLCSMQQKMLVEKINNGLYTMRTLIGHAYKITRICKEETLLYSHSSDGIQKVWNLKTMKCLKNEKTLSNLNWIPHCFYTSEKEGIEISGFSINLIKIWDLTTTPQQCLATINVPSLGSSTSCLYMEKNVIYSTSGHMIQIYDFNTPLTRLLEAAKALLNEGDLTLFSSFGSSCKKAVYKELQTQQAFQRATNEQKAQAIYRYVLKEIAALFENGSATAAHALFKKLPTEIQTAVHSELPEGEQPLLSQAILTYLAKTAR